MKDAGPPPFSDCPIPISETEEILLGHGSGGKLTARLIESLILPALASPALEALDDQAVVSIDGTRLA
ncbi:MAG: hydrogenase expression/formation protein HypE, partial [Acidobacteriota bacterium]|nr:hydrogenase expression/formation protein HypE [Acidobacteriota bacterium]